MFATTCAGQVLPPLLTFDSNATDLPNLIVLPAAVLPASCQLSCQLSCQRPASGLPAIFQPHLQEMYGS
eukprot:3596097-Prymnesium_polylepis.1